MILTDVNVLIYAFRAEASQHEAYAGWLTEVINGADELALHDPVLAGFVRIVTNPRIMSDPAPTRRALDFVTALRGAERARWIPSGHQSWEVLGRFVDGDAAVRANLIPDAHLAATALAHGARLATVDHGFARYPGLRWFDPRGRFRDGDLSGRHCSAMPRRPCFIAS